jgi:hypothetical protein
MKRLVSMLSIAVACIGACWGAYRAMATPETVLSRWVPSGSLLYLEAKDFSLLLGAWNNSGEKRIWLKSDNYEVFSRSRLFLRLNDAGTEFSKAAGLPADTKMLNQLAGTQSALAVYDIGKLHFLYITRLPSASAMQSILWETRSKFETRSAGGATFYVRRDPESEREVAFAVAGDYLLLATREDLIAGALKLIAGGKENSIETEGWWAQSVAAAGAAGDLRLVLNLEKIVPSPYFRSYWIQQNVSEMKQYSSGICDLVRSGDEYREERVLIKKATTPGEVPKDGKGAAAVAEILRLVPAATSSFYEARANPAAADALVMLETKILAPHLGPVIAERYAPQVALGDGQTGVSSDLETRIDQPSIQQTAAVGGSTALHKLFELNPIAATLETQSSGQEKGGVFVRLHAGVVLLGESDWDESAVHAALVEFLRPSITTGQLGLQWRSAGGYGELDGLWTLAVAVRGKYLLISDQPALLTEMLANMNQKSAHKPAIYAAGFNHALEREKFTTLAGLLNQPGGGAQSGDTVDFFSGNVSSLSATLAYLSSENIVVRDAGDKVLQTATYEWDH